MGCFEAGALAAHHEQKNPAGGEGFCKSDQPDSQFGSAVHQAEEIENVVGLGADWFALLRDQVTLVDFDHGDALLGDQFLDQPLAALRIGFEIAGTLQGGGEQLGAKRSCWRVGGSQLLQL